MSTYRTKHPYSFNSEFLLPVIAIMLILLSIFIINLFSASDRRHQPVLDPVIAKRIGIDNSAEMLKTLITIHHDANF
jgi:hypothetical protein